MPVGTTTGADGVMVAESEAGAVVVYVIASGVAAFSTQPAGRGTVTIRPVGSTVGRTAGSLEVTVKVSVVKSAPTGDSVPV